MKVTFGVCLFLAAGLCRAADLRQIQEFYRTVLQSEDDSRLLVPGTPFPPGVEDDGIKALSAQDAETLLPLAQKCWQSPRAGVVRAGFGLLIMVSLRPDSSKLLDPYVDDLAKLLTAPEQGVRGSTVYILGATLPKASPRALAYLVAHLSYKNSSSEELRMTAAAILASRPSAAGTVHLVLTAVEQRPEFKLKADVILALGLYRITSEEALEYIGSGLTGQDRTLRQASIGALEQLPKEARGRFIPDLQRIAGDPDETPAVRSSAESVLTMR
jgi:hypothetical protein